MPLAFGVLRANKATWKKPSLFGSMADRMTVHRKTFQETWLFDAAIGKIQTMRLATINVGTLVGCGVEAVEMVKKINVDIVAVQEVRYIKIKVKFLKGKSSHTKCIAKVTLWSRKSQLMVKKSLDGWCSGIENQRIIVFKIVLNETTWSYYFCVLLTEWKE